MNSSKKPRLIGINHVALEVGDIEEALDFYGTLFGFELRGRGPGRAFLDMGDQFLALFEGREQAPDDHRHFGLVVDDRADLENAARKAGATILETDGLDFLDPWGNRLQVVEYADIQFLKADSVLAAIGLKDLGKSDEVRKDLQDKGLVEG